MKKKYQITLVVIGCLIALLGLSYAYFAATNTGGGAGGSTTVETVTLDDVGFSIEGMLEFNDLDIYPGHKNISKIKVTALGNNDTINYKLVWEGINTLNTPLKYYVYKTTTNEEPSITCKKEIEQVGASKYYYETCTNNSFDNLGTIVNQGEITKTTEKQEFILSPDEVIKGTEVGNVIYYYVVLEYPNLEESQNIDMGGKFEGIVTVKKESDLLADITIKKMYKQNENGYEEITAMPDNTYIINTEKSTCTNNAIPTIKNNKILVTNLNTSGTECNIYFDKDNIAPTITNVEITATETEINVVVSATDNIGVTEYYYQIDSNEVIRETTNTYAFTGLTASTNHTINVYVKDNAGNISEVTTKTITTIDITKPVINNVTTSGTETEITVIVDATDNVGVAEYYFAIGSGDFSKSTTNTFKFTGLTAGVTHNIKVYVKDASGNQSETTTKSVATPDTTNPIIDNITTSVTETEINVVVSATDNTEVTEYWYAIDSGTFTKGTGNTYKFTGLSPKTTHTIKAYVKDKFGNQSATLTTSATTIDSTKPEITNVTSTVTMTEINVTVTATDNVGVTEYYYKIDNGSFTKGTGNTYKFTGLGINSSHTISIYVKDASGNQSDTSTSVIVTAQDSVKPTISNVTTSVTKTEISVTVTASDNVGVTEYWYQIDSQTAIKQTTNTYKFTGLTAGTTHSVKVYVKDAAGNQSDTTTKSVTTTKPTASEAILGNITYKTTTPAFSDKATTDEGVYRVSDGIYGGYSYYWRGAATNNYVKFAGFCWRIIRINGDSSIRLIYDGTTCHTNGTKTTNNLVANQAYNTSYDRSEYVGWTYSHGKQRTLSGTSSNAKSQLESWYSSNITGTNANNVANGKYCNNRDVGEALSSWSGYGTTWSINGTPFAHTGLKRLWETFTPTLTCNSGDTYTSKVGLITGDEVEFAGGGGGKGNNAYSNTYYYLYNGYEYWTMTPTSWSGTVSGVFIVSSSGELTSGSVHGNFGLRPVINLNSNVTFSGGTGTQTDPYVVS